MAPPLLAVEARRARRGPIGGEVLREPAELALARVLSTVLQHVIEEVAALSAAVQRTTRLVVYGVQGAGPGIPGRRAMLALPVAAERAEVRGSATRAGLFSFVH